MEQQNPTYEQLAQAYNNAIRELENVRMECQAIRSDKVLERLNTMMHIVENKDKYDKSIVKLANWHMKQIMSKPKA